MGESVDDETMSNVEEQDHSHEECVTRGKKKNRNTNKNQNGGRYKKREGMRLPGVRGGVKVGGRDRFIVGGLWV